MVEETDPLMVMVVLDRANAFSYCTSCTSIV